MRDITQWLRELNPRKSFLRIPVMAVVLTLSLVSAPKAVYTERDKAFYADEKTVNFVRPGLVIKINSADVASDGTFSTVFTLSDPKGLPLDRDGITTPGNVAVSFIAASIPAGQEQYVAYTTRIESGPVIASAVQAAADSGGTFTKLAEGQYRYTFRTKAPAGFNRAVTHTIGAYGSRVLTEFDLGTNYASTTFNWVPDGSAVTTTRDVIKTASCNKCHDQLSAHGGSRRGVELCVMCHTPQTTDAQTGNTLDLKVMAHKIHMGKQLPSVIAGKPYQIIGFNNSVNDWSTVGFPSDPRRCESCHDQKTGAAQATAYLTKPTRAACGACHDNVNFATGDKHAGGPQFSDNQCSTCHIPEGEIEFDASIKGAHTMPQESTMLSGLSVELLKVDDGAAGKKPTVTLTVKDKSGAGIPFAQLNRLALTMAGSTKDYGYTSFGSDVTTPGYVSETLTAANTRCSTDGTCVYTFQHAIPADAKGTYTIGVESRRVEILLPGTTKQLSVQYGAINKLINFPVDGSPMQPRRTIVDVNNCNQCHTALALHGANRNQPAYCVMCHNPSQTDSGNRVNARDPNDKALPAQGVNFALLIHRIHSGELLKEDGRDYTVVGNGGSHNDFSEVRYPAMSPTGAAGDRRNCAMCHVGGSEQVLPTGLNAVNDPQGPINPVLPVTSACTGCHVSIPAASHALANTTILGESCEACHSAARDFSVSKEHAQY
jgi:OmcA/MtrC family decaheme c-type cytochrome